MEQLFGWLRTVFDGPPLSSRNSNQCKYLRAQLLASTKVTNSACVDYESAALTVELSARSGKSIRRGLLDFPASTKLSFAKMSESSVLHSIRDAWSERQSLATLSQLRKDYPRYSDNELYAIWCHLNGLVPFDSRGKVLIEQWQMHAEEDGKHLQANGFKVSRPLYGRALRAQPGSSKPRQAARRSRIVEAEPAARPDGFMSPKALALAKQYDSAARILNSLIEKQRESQRVAEQLAPFSQGVLLELAANSEEAAEALRRAGLLHS